MNRVVVETLQPLRKARKVFRGVVFTSPRGEFLHNFGRAWAETVKNAKIPISGSTTSGTLRRVAWS
jgi:hypothetical protein